MSPDLASQWLMFVAFGLVAGFSSALLGIGGGVVLMPLLVMVASFDPNHARGTALGYMVGTCLVGAIAYHRMESVSLSLWVILLLTAGGVVGAVLGWAVGHRISPVWVKRLFAVVMILAAVKMFWGTLPGQAGAEPSRDKVEAGTPPGP